MPTSSGPRPNDIAAAEPIGRQELGGISLLMESVPPPPIEPQGEQPSGTLGTAMANVRRQQLAAVVAKADRTAEPPLLQSRQAAPLERQDVAKTPPPEALAVESPARPPAPPAELPDTKPMVPSRAGSRVGRTIPAASAASGGRATGGRGSSPGGTPYDGDGSSSTGVAAQHGVGADLRGSRPIRCARLRGRRCGRREARLRMSMRPRSRCCRPAMPHPRSCRPPPRQPPLLAMHSLRRPFRRLPPLRGTRDCHCSTVFDRRPRASQAGLPAQARPLLIPQFLPVDGQREMRKQPQRAWNWQWLRLTKPAPPRLVPRLNELMAVLPVPALVPMPGAAEPSPLPTQRHAEEVGDAAGNIRIGPRKADLPALVAALPGPGRLVLATLPQLGIPGRKTPPDGAVAYSGYDHYVLPRSGGGLPIDGSISEPTPSYEQREPSRRSQAAQAHGGTSHTEKVVEVGLGFFARIQFPDGHWSLHRLPEGFLSGPGFR